MVIHLCAQKTTTTNPQLSLMFDVLNHKGKEAQFEVQEYYRYESY